MPSKTIKFEIVTPERIVLKEMIQQITVPTKDGEITVLPEHVPLIASLKPGVIEFKNEKGDSEIISISGGFIEVLKHKVVILADTAERAHEIDIDRAEEAHKRAEDLKAKLTTEDREKFVEVTAQIEKQLARTKAAKRWKKININDTK